MKQTGTPGLILDTESANDWRVDELTAPVNIFVSQLIRIGKLPTSTPRPIPRARVAS